MARVYQMVKEIGPNGKPRWTRAVKPVAGGRWFIDYADHTGKQVREATVAQSKLEAQGILRVKLGEMARAEAAGFSNPAALSMTIERFLDEIYIPHLQATRRPNTVKNYEDYSDGLKARFGRKMLAEITREDVLDFQTWMLGEGRGRFGRQMSPATCNRRIGFLRAVLYEALARGYIGRNPAARIKLLPEENERTRVLSTIEERKLFGRLPEWLAQITQVALLTGLRQGEIFRLHRQDVNRDRRQIYVSPEAKDHEARYVPYPAILEPLLDKLIPRIGGKEGANPFLFCREDGKAFDRDDVQPAFRRAVRKAKIIDFHFHDLRRTYASRLVDLGVSLPVIAKLLGHGATYVTERYSHASDLALEAAVGLMDGKGGSRFLADAPISRTEAQ